MSKFKFDSDYSLGETLFIASKSDLQKLIAEERKALLTEPKKEVDRLLTRKEVKNMLKVSYGALWAWNISGELRNFKIGRRVYYYESEINKRLFNN